MNTAPRQTGAAARALTIKLAIILVTGAVFLIPLELVRGVIQERAERARQVTEEIAGKWAEPQTLRGPFLLLQLERSDPANPRILPKRRTVVLLPEDFTAAADVVTETRSRGIFDAEIYTARITLSGRFDKALLDSGFLEDDWRPRWDLAELALGLSDLRGLQEDLSLDWDGKSIAAEVGVPGEGLTFAGLHWPVTAFAGKQAHQFDLTLTLRGSAALSILPVGRGSELSVAGNWPAPSFDGVTLPQEQDVGDAGFTARWNLSHLSRSLPQSFNLHNWPGSGWQDHVVTVKFLDPVDFYRLSERSVKYGLLFIALTFLVLFLFEVLLGLGIHPVQYLQVGAALVLFFLNLVAFAEVTGFAVSYGISAFIVAGMIGPYVAAVLRRRLWGGLLFAVTAALYGLLFVILRQEEAALLSGSLVLMAALALTMFLTRKVDWYGLGQALSPSARPARSEAADESGAVG